MKRISTTLIALLLTWPAWAQIPGTVSFQGLLTDTGGLPLDTTVSIMFTLYDTTDAALWMETHPSVDVVAGVYNVRLGSLSQLKQIPFDQPYELGIKVGDDSEMNPRVPFDSVPYALSSLCPVATCEDFFLTTCPGGCKDLMGDENNCGDCDEACSAGELCTGGVCALSCPGDLAECTGTCVNTQTDEAHCGGCNSPCQVGELCQSGFCVPALPPVPSTG